MDTYVNTRFIIWLIAAVHVASVACAGSPPPALLERAEALLPDAAGLLALNEELRIHWAEGSDSLWYRRETASGYEYVRVSLPNGKREPLFDHSRLAAALGKAAGRRIEPAVLVLDEGSFDLERRTVETSIDEIRFGCDLEEYTCVAVRLAALPAATSRSPDGRYDLIRDGYNLKLEDRSRGQSTSLTVDGSVEQYYGADVFLERDDALGLDQKPPVVWSSDSRRAATIRLNVTGVGRTTVLQTPASTENPRPRAISFHFPMLEDTRLPMAELVLVDAESARVRVITSEPWPLPSGAPFTEDPSSSLGWWSEDASNFFWLQVGRGNHTVSLWSVDAETGKAQEVLAESSQTRVGPQQGFIDPRNTHILPETQEVLWFSERDGWGHLYLYDARTDSLKRRLTEGPWLVRELLHVDAAKRMVYFTAGGREAGRNPYFRHLYRASLDSGKPELLTNEDADHAIQFSPDGRFFVDTFSRIDTAPQTVVRNNRGELIAVLETADLTALLEAGWRFPEPFETRASDGETPIYGALFYPRDFDTKLKYGIINDIYPLTRAPAGFSLDASQALADLGFIVVTLNARGSTGRSKAFHDAGYGLMGGRLDDHVAALRKLAAERPALDLDRVGIIGHSWGGAAAARAILTYPNFFRVAVSSSGVHDLRIAQGWFAESVVGLSDRESEEATNLHLAERLAGKLLLAHGGGDYWTHPAHTMRLTQKLLDADKDIDLILLPERGHNVPSSPHFRRRSWEFFLRHLGPPVVR